MQVGGAARLRRAVIRDMGMSDEASKSKTLSAYNGTVRNPSSNTNW
jgi:hypothetical protein